MKFMNDGDCMKKIIYKLEHKRKVEYNRKDGWICNSKLIGYYLTKKYAVYEKNKYKDIAGFRDYPGDFYITKVILDKETKKFRTYKGW